MSGTSSYQKWFTGEGYPPVPERESFIGLMKYVGWWEDLQKRRVELFDGGMTKKDAYFRAYAEFWCRYCDEKPGGAVAVVEPDPEPEPESEPMPDGVSPQQILAEVKRSGRTCDYDTLLDWVGEHIIVPWDQIDVNAIPSTQAVNWLVAAKESAENADKFWGKYHAHRTKKKDIPDEDEAERDLRRHDSKTTTALIAEFNRAFADGGIGQHAAQARRKQA